MIRLLSVECRGQYPTTSLRVSVTLLHPQFLYSSSKTSFGLFMDAKIYD